MSTPKGQNISIEPANLWTRDSSTWKWIHSAKLQPLGVLVGDMLTQRQRPVECDVLATIVEKEAKEKTSKCRTVSHPGALYLL